MSIYDDPARLQEELLRIGNTAEGRRYLDGFKLTESLPADPYTPPEDPEEETGLTADLCDAAVRQLAERHGKTVSEVDSLLRLTHQRADLGYSVSERAAVISQVERSLRRGLREPERQQILELSRGQSDYGDAEAERILELSAEPGDGDEAGLTVALSASAGPAELARHAAVYGESADAIRARYPEFFGV